VLCQTFLILCLLGSLYLPSCVGSFLPPPSSKYSPSSHTVLCSSSAGAASLHHSYISHPHLPHVSLHRLPTSLTKHLLPAPVLPRLSLLHCLFPLSSTALLLPPLLYFASLLFTRSPISTSSVFLYSLQAASFLSHRKRCQPGSQDNTKMSSYQTQGGGRSSLALVSTADGQTH